MALAPERFADDELTECRSQGRAFTRQCRQRRAPRAAIDNDKNGHDHGERDSLHQERCDVGHSMARVVDVGSHVEEQRQQQAALRAVVEPRERERADDDVHAPNEKDQGRAARHQEHHRVPQSPADAEEQRGGERAVAQLEPRQRVSSPSDLLDDREHEHRDDVLGLAGRVEPGKVGR